MGWKQSLVGTKFAARERRSFRDTMEDAVCPPSAPGAWVKVPAVCTDPSSTITLMPRLLLSANIASHNHHKKKYHDHKMASRLAV